MATIGLNKIETNLNNPTTYKPPRMSLEYVAKSEKYRRYKNEAAREPGQKRLQTQKIITTKWEPEIAQKKTNNISRKRARDDKYGKWNDDRGDSCCEDKVNETANAAMRERLRVAALERRGIFQRTTIDSDTLFPVFYLNDKMSWPTWAWASYYELKETEGIPTPYHEFRAEQDMWARADANERIENE